MSNIYRVVVTGKQLIADLDEIRSRVLEIFDLPEKQLEALLGGKALVIKKNVDASSAMKYKKALSACGLEVLIEPMNEEPILEAEELYSSQHETSLHQPAPQKQEVKPKPVAKPEATDIKMAPTGSRIGPRPSIARFEMPNIDHLSAGISDRLAPESEPGPPPPDVSHIDMSEVGEILIEPTEQAPLEIDVASIEIAEVGATLGEITASEPLFLDLDHLEMAPVGETLSESKEVKPLQLNISHISIDESSLK